MASSIAAVIGRTFEEELLVAVAARADVREDLRELVRRDLIRVTGDGSPAEPAPSRAYDPASAGDRAPGHEESGGYVDVDDHRY